MFKFFQSGFLLLAAVLSFSVNGTGNLNRSGTNAVQIGFTDPTTIQGASSFYLIDRTVGNTIDLSGQTLSGNGTNVVSLNLLSLDLQDGRYLLVLPADQTNPQISEDKVFSFHKLAGDVDGDGLVNFNDYFAVRDNFNQSGLPYRAGDADGDGLVNFNDYFWVRDHFNNSL